MTAQLSDQTSDRRDRLVEAVCRAVAATTDERLRTILESLVRHLHAFLREVHPSEREFEHGLRFVRSLGELSNERRDETIIAADVLGLSSLVTLMNEAETASAAALLGPFWRPDAPLRQSGDNIVADVGDGEAMLVRGTVYDEEGEPVAGAMVDIWQAASNGLYDCQDPDQPDMNGRGRFLTDGKGRYEFRTLRPVPYSLPEDGPVADLLRATGRRPFRPAHLHFMITKGGKRTLVTQLFVDDDIDPVSDVTFSVVPSLIARPLRLTANELLIEYDFRLAPIVG